MLTFQLASSTLTRHVLSLGHYARKSWSSPTSPDKPPRPKLLSAADHNKDQSYYLSSISEKGLRDALFPLQNLNKPQVRELAKKYRLPTADRAESMGLCFVGEKAQFDHFLCIPPCPCYLLYHANCYVSFVTQHHTFHPILARSWTSQLTRKLESTLGSGHTQSEKEPRSEGCS